MATFLICDICGAGPFKGESGDETKQRFMHWYDSAHLTYRVVQLPEDTPERKWNEYGEEYFVARNAQRQFDMSEPS